MLLEPILVRFIRPIVSRIIESLADNL